MKPFRRAWRPRALSELLAKTLDPLAAQLGMSQASLVTHWPEIAGARIAGVCEPVRLRWPPRGPKTDPERRLEPATLILRVEPAFALEIQHLTPTLLARANAHLGWRCVDKIQIRQEPLSQKPAPKPPRASPSRAAQNEAAALTQNIENPKLKAALTALGAEVFSEREKAGE